MNIVTMICIGIGLVCLYYDALMVEAPDDNVPATIQKIVDSVHKGKFN
ncbi:MAG: hypothetical protein Q8L78_04455 [Coxiellaceae bacterium]|nr:hypothetical protein [Coxiellaceae bacterium]